MTPLLLNQASFISALTDAIAGFLAGAEIHLYKNNLVFDPATTEIGDLVEADYAGYAAVVVTWGAASVSDAGDVETIGSAQTWRPTNSVTPNDIYGFFIDDGAGVLLAGGYFDGAPLPMNSALDVIRTSPVLRLDNTGYVSTVS